MKIKQTLKEYKCAVFSIGCAVSIPLIIFLATLIGDRCQAPESTPDVLVRCGHFFTNWLYDFQTLLAGFFALIAAAITVYMMHRNTVEIGNTEWRVTINNVTYTAKLLLALLSDLENQQPIISNNWRSYRWIDWDAIFKDLISYSKHIKYVLQAADEAGLSLQAAGLLKGDIDVAERMVSSLETSYHSLKNVDALTDELSKEFNKTMQEVFIDVQIIRKQSLHALLDILKNPQKFNPRNLRRLVDN